MFAINEKGRRETPRRPDFDKTNCLFYQKKLWIMSTTCPE